MVGDDGFMVSAATLFPNLSFVHNWPQVDDAGTVVAVHLDPPVAAGLGDRDRGAVVVRRRPRGARGRSSADSYRAYLMCFGSSGMFEQDDVENWVSITDVSRGRWPAGCCSTAGWA